MMRYATTGHNILRHENGYRCDVCCAIQYERRWQVGESIIPIAMILLIVIYALVSSIRMYRLSRCVKKKIIATTRCQ